MQEFLVNIITFSAIFSCICIYHSIGDSVSNSIFSTNSVDPNSCVEHEPRQCDPTDKYRTLDGSCNNLRHPYWGAQKECFLRLEPSHYEGTSGFRQSTVGSPLPGPRKLSTAINVDMYRPSSNVTSFFTVFGQFLSHDIALSSQDKASVECCSPEAPSDPLCIPVIIPPDDHFYSQFNVTCIHLNRTRSCSSTCTGKREQANFQTAYIDASHLYGPNVEKMNTLKHHDDKGKLGNDISSAGTLLQRGYDPNDQFCFPEIRQNCFMAGDPRVNIHAPLTGIHTLYLREHNRIVDKLKMLRPQWDGEKLFQEARRILTAGFQSISYGEWLPILLGSDYIQKYDLGVQEDSGGTSYQPDVRLGTFNEFTTAAMRLHSMVSTQLGMPDLRYEDLFSNPEFIRNGHMGSLVKGQCAVAAQKFDRFLVTDMTEHLAEHRGRLYGKDLASINIQRGRDHGLAPYVHLVNYCTDGMVNISSFDDLEQVMSRENAKLLKENYKSVEDIDLWLGLQLEHHPPGSLVGSTSACIIARQFHVLKFADRFYWEHDGQVASFNKDQRNELKKSSVARLLCDNNIETTHIQRNAFLLHSPQNPVVPCDLIEQVDISLLI